MKSTAVRILILFICLSVRTELCQAWLWRTQPVDAPSIYRDAPDSILNNCLNRCMKHDSHRIICHNYPTVAHKCMDLCDGKWQKNWIFLSDIMQKCLGIYYQRYEAAYYAYNDKDCGISTDSFTYLADDRRFKILDGRNAHRYQFPWALKLINQPNSSHANFDCTRE